MGLLDQLKRSEAAAAATDAARYRDQIARVGGIDRYRELLAGNDPAKLGALREAMSSLGLTVADVESDVAALTAFDVVAPRLPNPQAEAAADRALAEARREVRGEAHAALLGLLETASERTLVDVVTELFHDALRPVRDDAERARLIARFGRERSWSSRLTTAETEHSQWGERARRAVVDAERLRRDHPAFSGISLPSLEGDRASVRDLAGTLSSAAAGLVLGE